MNRHALRFAIFTLAALASSAALAEETICRGTLGPSAFNHIFVPDNASCTLNRSRAKGSVVVGRGASLQANGVHVNGNIEAEGALQVGIGPGSQVGGNVQIKQGGGASITGVRISGDIHFDNNQLPLAATDNLIGGNVQVVKNLGGVTLERNHIDGVLRCTENRPTPVGGQNQASVKEIPCATL